MVFHPKIVRKVQKFTWNGPEKVYFIQGSRRVWCTAISRKNLNWKKKLGKIWKMLTLAISRKNVENEKLDLFRKKSIAPKCKPVAIEILSTKFGGRPTEWQTECTDVLPQYYHFLPVKDRVLCSWIIKVIICRNSCQSQLFRFFSMT